MPGPFENADSASGSRTDSRARLHESIDEAVGRAIATAGQPVVFAGGIASGVAGAQGTGRGIDAPTGPDAPTRAAITTVASVPRPAGPSRMMVSGTMFQPSAADTR